MLSSSKILLKAKLIVNFLNVVSSQLLKHGKKKFKDYIFKAIVNISNFTDFKVLNAVCLAIC